MDINYGNEPADQIVRYSMDGIEHGLRLSGTMAKHLAIFIVAVLKDQKKTRGKTRMIRMLKADRALKFFKVPSDRLKEFGQEGKKYGLLYVVIRDRKNPQQCEVMVYADDAAKVNRVMDKMNLDYVKSETGEALHEAVSDVKQEMSAKTEDVKMPEGEVRFEINDLDNDFNFAISDIEPENFTQAQEAGRNPSESSLRSNDISTRVENQIKKPSVREELNQIKEDKKEVGRKKERSPKRSVSKGKKKGRTKNRMKGR